MPSPIPWAVATAALALVGCPARRPTPGAWAPATAADVRVDDDDARRRDTRPGDLWIPRGADAGAPLAVISKAAPGSGRQRPLGALVDLVPAGRADDLLQDMRPWVRVDGAAVEPTAIVVAPSAEGVVVRRELPGGLRLVTTWSRAAGSLALQARSTLSRGGSAGDAGPDAAVDVEVGDRLQLGNVAAFVPGAGDVEGDADLDAFWVGRASRGQAVAYGPATGDPMRVRVAPLRIGDTSFAGPIEARVRSAALQPGGALSWSAFVVATAGDLAAAARVLMAAQRRTLRTLAGRVVRPDGRPPAAGTAVVEVTAAGSPHLRATPDADGRFEIALGPGPVELVAVGPDGRRSAVVPATPGRDGVHLLTLPGEAVALCRVRDASGAPLAARVVAVGPDGDRRTAYTADGAVRLPLPPGAWTLYAAHGFEHDIASARIAVSEGAPAHFDATLAHAAPTPGWVSADLHLHAQGSGDSEVLLRERVEGLVAEGVEVAVASDHNRITDYGPAVRELGVERRIHVIAGAELSTTGARRWGHFNAFPLTGQADAEDRGAPAWNDTTPRALFAAARAHPGEQVVQVNHPRMPPEIGYFDLAGLDPETGRATAPDWDAGFDAIEVWNGIWLAFPDRVEANQRDWHALLNRGLRVAATGNSDSHRLVTQEVGWPRTYLAAAEDDPGALSTEGVVAALRNGRTYVTSGPLLRVALDGKGPGGTVVADGRETAPLEVWVHAAPWVPVRRLDVIVDGATLWAIPVPPAASALRFHGRFDIRLADAHWVSVRADGGRHSSPVAPVPGAWSVAFTSPVHIDHRASSQVQSTSENYVASEP